MINAKPTLSEWGTHLTEKHAVRVIVTITKTIGVRAIDRQEAITLATNRVTNKTKALQRSGNKIADVTAEYLGYE